ncbi:unnamed protein product [Phytophthora fragariaefolia]|uniref:Unnamed protein product n=1 Tax=Phytophthora fragariaefolia TaxID=1490495 RepID=A0A9W6XYU2_9STRA|nr:unnamed protein product [Phytophthora fragariaefolia]
MNVAKRFTEQTQTWRSPSPLEHPGISEMGEQAREITQGAALKKKITNSSAMTSAEDHAYDWQLAKTIENADEFAFDENVPVRDVEEGENKGSNTIYVDAKVRNHYEKYLSMINILVIC